MYKRVRVRDTVEVPPGFLADISPNRVCQLLQDELEGRIDAEVGSIIGIIEVHEVGEGIIVHGDPSAYFEAEFDILTFDPQMQEVVDGIVVEVVEFGAFIGMGPVDGLLHISQISEEYLSYDGENQQLASTESNRTLGVGDEIRVRIVTRSINERQPRDTKIGLTAKQKGLGKHGWLREDREQRIASSEDE